MKPRQLWASRSSGRFGLPCLAKIGRRPDDAELGAAEPAGDQARVLQKAEAHADVDAFADEIDDAVVEGAMDVDVRIARLERAQQRRHLDAAERDRHVDAQVAGGLELRVFQNKLGLLDVGERLAAALEEGCAVLGQADAPRGAGEQPGADLVFQPADGVADAGLGDAELGGGTHEGEALRHFDEDRKGAQVGHRGIHHQG